MIKDATQEVSRKMLHDLFKIMPDLEMNEDETEALHFIFQMYKKDLAFREFMRGMLETYSQAKKLRIVPELMLSLIDCLHKLGIK